MKIICDACSAKYSIADEKVRGKVFKIRCKKCSNVIVVRGTEDSAAAPKAVQEKETQVYNYNDPDGEGVWHLVIDDEQVGPMTEDDVRARFAAGDIDAESFIWKDGMGDWEPITQLPEFADLGSGVDRTVADASAGAVLGAPAQGSDSRAPSEADSIFGGVDVGAPSSEDPDDIFSKSTVASPSVSEEAAASMFGTEGVSSEENDIFGSQSAPSQDSAQLTGQRSDNSVLFSLGDLAGAPQESAALASSSSSSQGEGSGLIDIRSMAQVYLGEQNATPSTASMGSDDDLPVFSQTGFDHASPVLLPTESGSDDKLKLLLFAAVGVLGLVAVLLIFVLLRGGDNKGGEQASADDNQSAVTDNDDVDISDDDKKALPQASERTNAGAKDQAQEKAEDQPDDDVEETPDPQEDKTAKDNGRDNSRKRNNRTNSRTRNSRDRSAKTDSSPKEEDPKPQETSSGGSCDEISCLVTPNKACCKKYQSKSTSRQSSSGSSSNSDLPEQLSRGDVTKGISGVKSRVQSCGSKSPGAATVKAKMKISGSGRVSSVSTSGGNAALSKCVASAVKRANFRKTQKGMTVTYPFTFK